jgi:RNA polymerase sigma factor (sigma-70 family)
MASILLLQFQLGAKKANTIISRQPPIPIDMSLSEDDIHHIYLGARSRLHQFLSWRVQCPDTASDLLQEVYLRLPLLKPPPQTQPEVQAWLYRVASNLSVDHIRTQQRHFTLLEMYGGGCEEPSDARTEPDRAAVAAEELQQVSAALSELPERCTEVLYLSRIQGLTHSEIARKLGISKSLVEKQIMRALNHCRQAIDDEE